ncbi:cell division topological specificity factor MinE [Cutibacterium sp.]|uniref:cell division topological specificity factor MinE n=1 Tax=Cutibacterium sp. TaxID=1912221 RepID=UPI0026DD8152|nr:cell division topological specificity factor MinE [Cutibacterium sp.]MDO4412769.1 cell division topological specificity factor MinE [Cutibacterium sp.]
MINRVSGVHDLKRVEKDSGERKGVLVILIVATVVAIACGVIPSIWAARAGVLVALVGAWVSVFMAWRQVDAMRRMHYDALKELRHAASEQEKRHHAESMEMIDTFSRRVGSISKALADTRAKLDRAETELSTLRGDKAALQYKVTAGNKKVTSLEMHIAELETELDTLLAEGRSGRLGALRTVTDAGVPTADEIWERGNDATIADLSRVAFPRLSEETRVTRRQA